MGDMGDYYKDTKECYKEKRWNDYELNKKRLEDAKVEFEEKANGHFVIKSSGMPVADFWATKGKFITRESEKKGFGVEKLLRIIENKEGK